MPVQCSVEPLHYRHSKKGHGEIIINMRIKKINDNNKNLLWILGHFYSEQLATWKPTKY